ncbi:MAG: ATP-grasp domain-containing protein [Planctomycetes bacterium]|nr:ATP-grasp domain-containing protein [Planctomycetota bacterium]
MVRVLFVAPFALDTTMRFVRAAASLPDVELGIVTQEPFERLGADLKSRISGFERVDNAENLQHLRHAVRKLAHSMHGIDRVVGILEQLQVPLAELRQELGIEGLSVDAAHNFRDKARMKDRFGAAQIPCAKHRRCHSASEAMHFAEQVGFPVVAKPIAGAGARNTARLETVEQLGNWLRSFPPTPKAPLMLEEFVTGREFSFDSASIRGRHLLHSITEYFPTPLEVMENPWIQWCVLLRRELDRPEYAPIFEAGPRALDTLGMHTGLTHMEWFARPDGSIAISEVAARPPGAQFTSLLSYAYDFDFYRGWAELVSCDRFDVPKRRYSVGAAFLRGQGRGKVKKIHGIEEARRDLGDLVVEAKLPKTGQPGASSYEGEGYVILRGEDSTAIEQALARVVRTIRVELA